MNQNHTTIEVLTDTDISEIAFRTKVYSSAEGALICCRKNQSQDSLYLIMHFICNWWKVQVKTTVV